jgi:GDP-4-dehydro-6-deoxy-D-mannose reductase
VDSSRPVLITGVGGFLGRRLAAALVAEGRAVVGAGPEGEHCGLEGVLQLPLDVRDTAAVAALIADVDPAAVVHLAALSHVGSSWQRIPEHFQTNVLGTEAVVDAAVGRRLVFASSAEVYGLVPEHEQPIREERLPAPANPYAFGKAAAERVVRRGGGVVLRCFNVVGPGQARSFALPAFARQLAEIRAGLREPRLAVGNLEAIRDFVHVDDAIGAFLVVLETGAPGAVYNVASGSGSRLADVVARMVELSGLEVAIEVDPERLRPVDVPRLEGDSSRLEALGWRRRRCLDDALRELLDEATAEVET